AANLIELNSNIRQAKCAGLELVIVANRPRVGTEGLGGTIAGYRCTGVTPGRRTARMRAGRTSRARAGRDWSIGCTRWLRMHDVFKVPLSNYAVLSPRRAANYCS